ncbi:hypothetical protein CC2G_005126 [Coprinopsis cinerea AmutBmut pab1-1]|nr:hypothetical protein CC2G_005126 [Coprinopsis cinerea AmutBmut pab1-1]
MEYEISMDPRVDHLTTQQLYKNPRVPQLWKASHLVLEDDTAAEVWAYIERMETMFEQASVVLDRHKKKALVDFVKKVDLKDQWSRLTQYRDGTYAQFKAEILSYYPGIKELQEGSLDKLEKIFNRYVRIKMHEEQKLMDLIAKVRTEVSKIRETEKKRKIQLLSERTLVQDFLACLDRNFRMAVQVRLSTADQRRILAELKRESRANARTLDKRLKKMEAPKGPKVEPEEGKEGGPSTAPEGDLGTEVNPIQVEDDGDDDFDGELYDSSGLERVMPIVTKYTLDDLLYVAQVVAREHSNSSVFGFTTDLSDTGTADQDVINTAVAETLKRLGIKPKREEQHVQDAGPTRGSQNMPPGMYQWSGPPKSDNDGFKLILERLDQQEAKWKDTLTGLRKEQKEQLTEFETRMEAKIDKRLTDHSQRFNSHNSSGANNIGQSYVPPGRRNYSNSGSSGGGYVDFSRRPGQQGYSQGVWRNADASGGERRGVTCWFCGEPAHAVMGCKIRRVMLDTGRIRHEGGDYRILESNRIITPFRNGEEFTLDLIRKSMESSGHTLDLDAIKREAQYVQEEPPEHKWRDPLTGQPTQEQLVHDLKERVSQLETEKAQSLGDVERLPSVLPKFASTRGFSMTTRKAAAAASSKPAGSSKTELEKSKKTAGVEKENTNKKERVEEKESESEEEEVDELQEEEEEPLRFVEVKRVGPPKKKKKVTWSDSQPTAKLTPSGTLPYVDVPPLSTKPLGAFKPKVNKEEEKSFEKEREVEEKGEPLPEIDRRGPAYNKRAPVEQNGAAKAIVNELLEVTVPVNIKSLMGVSPEAREYLKNLLTRKRVPTREVPIPRETEVFKRFFDDPHEVKRLHVGLQWVENSEEAMAKAEAVVEQRALAEKQNRDYKEASTLRPAVRTIAEKGDEKPLGSITISDPVEQYMIELGTEAKPVIVKAEESSSLRVIYPEINGAMKEESLLDGGSTICSMHEQAAKDHGLTWDPAVTVWMSSADKGLKKSLGLARDVPFVFGEVRVYLQIHVLPDVGYRILLGRPFEMIAETLTKNNRDGSQTITLTDPQNGKVVRLNTYPRGEPPPELKAELDANRRSFQNSMNHQ